MIIRWVCRKDNKKWIYPVEKCIYCKGPIEKVVSREARVIGITRVNVPSLLHPIVPYNVVLLEDEHGNRMPKKTMKDYRIGDNFRIEKAKGKNAVSIMKVKYDIKEALRESIELIGFEIAKDDKILIKPSIIEPAYPYQAVNTNPKILEALLEILKEKGISDVIVAEQSWPGNDTLASAEKSEIAKVCKKHGCSFVDLRKAQYSEREAEGMRFNIADAAFERKIISVPALKTNSQIGISGAMENMMRVADDKTQEMMHVNDIEKSLPKLIKALPEFLTIGDGIIGMHGQGPTSSGEPAFLSMILASRDCVAMDAVFAEMGMLPKPEYVKEAGILGVGNADIKSIEIIGDDLQAAKFGLSAASRDATSHPRIRLIDGKAPPSIFGAALGISSRLVGLSGYEMHIATGKFITEDMVTDKERIVAYGKDAIERMKELGVQTAADIPEELDSMEKIVLVKGILEDQNKKRISGTDRVKSKLASFGVKLKKSFSR